VVRTQQRLEKEDIEMGYKRLEDLCGRHRFSGCELTRREDGCGVCRFTLDDVTYEAVEDPDDGYRSFCSDLEIVKRKPRYTFPAIEVLCSMKEDDDFMCYEVLVIRDAKNGKTVLEVGTENIGDYYPCCCFSYTPENMSCNN